MDFLSRTQVVTAFGAVALALFVLDLVRRRRLSEEYSLLWVACTVSIAALGFSTPLLLWITRLLGMTGAASVAFAAGLAFVMAMLLFLSVKMSRLGRENLLLARELALLRFELEHVRGTRPEGEGA
jgi:hypothetical protein